MKKRWISEELIAFVSDYIDSVHTLEVLLLLFGEPTRTWSVDDIHACVKSSRGAVEKCLVAIVAAGLAQYADLDRQTFQYAPKLPALGQRTKELAAAYAERSTAVVELIYSRHIRVARSFSDAFDIRKKPEP